MNKKTQEGEGENKSVITAGHHESITLIHPTMKLMK